MRNKITRRKKNDPLIDRIFLCILILLFGICIKQLYAIEELFREWLNQPVYIYNVGHYKCGGTKKHPEFCPITFKQKVEE